MVSAQAANVCGPGLRKPVLSTQTTPIHIMVSISYFVGAIQNLCIATYNYVEILVRIL